MILINLSPVHVLAGLGALLVLVWVWRASVRRARRVATAARHGAKLASLAGRLLVAAGILGGVQWVLLTHPVSPYLAVGALAVPDVLAGYVLAKALTVTTVDDDRRRGGGGRR